MSEYTKDDIRVPGFKDAVKIRPEMYFGPRGINPFDICTGIADQALRLSATSVEINVRGDWYFVSADHDWLQDQELLNQSQKERFTKLGSLAEYGVGAVRSEVFSKYFSDSTFTSSTKQTILITGPDLMLPEYLAIIDTLREWDRIVGFKFNINA